MKVTKTALAALALVAASTAQAELSANLGFASDYYFRGILQAGSSANGGLDFESGGFYAGTWAADVKDGLEVDGYFGYGGELGDYMFEKFLENFEILIFISRSTLPYEYDFE